MVKVEFRKGGPMALIKSKLGRNIKAGFHRCVTRKRLDDINVYFLQTRTDETIFRDKEMAKKFKNR